MVIIKKSPTLSFKNSIGFQENIEKGWSVSRSGENDRRENDLNDPAVLHLNLWLMVTLNLT